LSNVVVKPHLFKLFIHALALHTDLRPALGTAQSAEDYEKVILEIERRIEMELQASPEKEGSEVPPWYRCQAFLRPDPGPKPEKKKRPHAEMAEGETEVEISK